MATINIAKLLAIVVVFTLMEPTISSQERTKDRGKLTSNKLNECRRCKVLTDSFNTWLDKTSRGKHEGGDVAWEEAKLKSYARSEMRFVEIQEGLCSELKMHKDHCYALAEEAEQVLEEWWFNKNNYSSDLYEWLCIENLQYCCPVHQFGEACTPCPQDGNNKVCAGKGKCDGDGTRKGNGTCICHTGYSGKYCEECSRNFYKTMNVCKSCHQACYECNGDGPNACIQCAPGWSIELGVCVDVNECFDLSVCKTSEFCINKEGSYNCESCDRTCKTCVGPNPKDCTSCTAPDNFLLAGKCINNDHKRILLLKVVFYLSLCILVIFISYRKSWYIASFVTLVTSFVIYFFEDTSDVKVIDVYNQYKM
ncbi:cysteine-rich with EGF-like domain protein 2 [Pararge aegeria]|nr:cysteine-rich with EGF-like domain protein 2 [Pararge aegeria]